ncbi:MAG: hypothetical protein M0Q98_09535 [Pseudomonas sp.]|nr:hypothetical protein [Pseudomonas sp.]MDD2223506.1 hypothetical protein [Pseudomonas sp.]MDY0415581.1 hypothetical protein [Pseudomonas sp.]
MSTHNKLTTIVTRVLVLSILACCLLVGVFWYFITAQQVRVPYMSPYELPEEHTAAKIDTSIALEFPLFWSGRRPIVEPDQESEESSAIHTGSIDGVQLLGIIVRDSVRTALLSNDQKLQKVVKGDEVNGWVVDQVFADKVVLMANDQISELSIVRERPDSIKLEPVAQ